MITDGSSEYHTDTESFERASEERQETANASSDERVQQSFIVPVARMVSGQDLTVSTKVSQVPTQGAAPNTGTQPTSSTSGPTQHREDMSSNNTRSKVSNDRTVKRREVWMRTQQDGTNKRQKLKSPGKTAPFKGSATTIPTHVGSQYESGSASSSLPSPVIHSPVRVANEPPTRNFPGILASREENKGTMVGSNVKTQPLTLQYNPSPDKSKQDIARLSTTIAVRQQQLDRGKASLPSPHDSDKEEEDCIQESPPSAPQRTRLAKKTQKQTLVTIREDTGPQSVGNSYIATTGTSSNSSDLSRTLSSFVQGNKPSLIVVLKLKRVPARLIRRDRKRLTLELRAGLELTTYNASALSEIISLVQKLTSTDTDTMKRWIEFVNIMVRFREATKFDGEQHTWDAYFTSLDDTSRSLAGHNLVVAGVAMDDWLLQLDEVTIEQFSRRVAELLLSMSEWMYERNERDIEKFTEGVTLFNKKLSAWFD
jgi:hypothetical protein